MVLGPFLVAKSVLGTSLFEIGPILITRSVLELLAFDQTCTNRYTTTPKLVGTSNSIVYCKAINVSVPLKLAKLAMQETRSIMEAISIL